LILTNDGKLTHNIISPKKHIPKTYYAKLDVDIDESAVKKFKEGITLGDGYKCMSASLNILDNREIELTIYEGKFHQVKRMFKALNNEVVYLKRIKMNNLSLDPKLELGEYKELSIDELKLLSE
jgi:16S rRNA pseudouridine516 synthase